MVCDAIPPLDHSQTSSPSREKEQKRKGEGREIDGMGHGNQAMEETPKERHFCTLSAGNWKENAIAYYWLRKVAVGKGAINHQPLL